MYSFKNKSLSLATLAVAMLVVSMTNAPAISVTNVSGRVLQFATLTGTVSNIDKSGYHFTLHWQGKKPLGMGRYWPSYQESYQVTDATVYKRGARAKFVNGARIRVTGRSYVVETVEFLK